MDAAQVGQIAELAKGVGTVLTATSQFRAAGAAGDAGKAVRASKEYEAALLRRRAGQERASSQRKAMAEGKKERLVQSALQARAAASGGGADPTVVDLAADIAAEGAYRKMTALYEGESLARALESGADIREWEGREAVRAGNIKKSAGRTKAAGTLLAGFDSLSAFSKFGEPDFGDDASNEYAGTRYA